MLAADRSHAEIIRILVAGGADVNAQNKVRLHTTVQRDEPLTHPRPSRPTQHGQTPLIVSIYDQTGCFQYILAHPRTRVDVRDTVRLWVIVLYECMSTFCVCIDRASPHLHNIIVKNLGCTPLHWAAAMPNIAAVRQLLADPRVDPMARTDVRDQRIGDVPTVSITDSALRVLLPTGWLDPAARCCRSTKYRGLHRRR